MFKLSTVVGLLLLILLLVPITFAQSNFRSQEIATLEKQEVINSDYFSTGEKVTLSGTVNGDAYLAGGNITVDGVVNGDLLVAGGNINVTGTVTGSVRAAGGNIQIDGQVGQNVTAAGGNVRIGRGAKVMGSLVAGAGSLEVLGPIGKGITVGGGSVTLANQVGSDIVAGVGQLYLTSTASVSGNLTYFSDNQATVASEASISGKITHNLPPRDQGRESFLAGAKTGWSLFTFLSLLAVGLMLSLIFPNFTQKTADLVTGKPLASLGVGFLVLILTPFLILLLFLTLIGIPLAILLLVGYIFLLIFSQVFAALALGQKTLGLLNQKANQALSLILGLLILALLGIIPIVGGIITFLAMLAGLGAYFMSKKAIVLELRGKKTL